MSKNKVEPLDRSTKMLMIAALEEWAKTRSSTVAQTPARMALRIANEVQSGKIVRVPEK